MKQKDKDLRTIVCSKRKKRVSNIVQVKNNQKDESGQTTSKETTNKLPPNGTGNVENCTVLEKHKSDQDSKPEKDSSDCIIALDISESHKSESNSDKKEENVLNERNASVDNTTNDQKENNSEVTEIETSERMPSTSSGKSISSTRTNPLSTILENVKGEEKEVKRPQPNETKFQTDKGLNGKVYTNKQIKCETKVNSDHNMDKGRRELDCPVTIPDTDSLAIKKTIDANEQRRIDLLTNRQPSNSSFKCGENTRLNSEQFCRPSSSKTDPGSVRSSSINGRNSTPKSKRIYSGLRFTKKELEYYLPRRSNFSCHEKALKDAGLDLDDIESKRKRRYHRSARTNILDTDIDEKLQMIEDANKTRETENTPDDENENETRDPEDEQTEMERLKLDKTRRKGKKKGDEPEIRVDHTVLLQYLKYVLENQEEYFSHKKQMLQQHISMLNIDPSCTIARFGRAFQRGQHGLLNETFLLEVIHGIKSNYGDSLQWLPQTKDKQLAGVSNIKVEQQETTIDEKDKTEYEKVKSKLDKWLKTTTTAQLLKAKELALKELGEEDKLQSQWWSTLQPCRYLRQRTSLF